MLEIWIYFQAIADVLGFRFRLYTVPDNLYGVINQETGEWNGIVRQLVDKRADLVSFTTTLILNMNSLTDEKSKTLKPKRRGAGA